MYFCPRYTNNIENKTIKHLSFPELVITMEQRVTVMHTYNMTSQIVWGVMLLLCGCAIYLLFRSQSIHLYQWAVVAGLSSTLDVLRQGVQHWQISDFVRFSLPDGLYCASYILLMDAVWKGGKTSRYLAVSLIPLVAITHELLQGIGLVRGTFDICDLLCYAAPLLVYFAVSNKLFIHFF